jgi:hypothetical protein
VGISRYCQWQSQAEADEQASYECNGRRCLINYREGVGEVRSETLRTYSGGLRKGKIDVCGSVSADAEALIVQTQSVVDGN